MKLTPEELTKDGWRDWMYDSPPFGKLIMFYRPEWEQPVVNYRENCRPEMNVAGLWWKLTAIGREAMKLTPPDLCPTCHQPVPTRGLVCGKCYKRIERTHTYTHTNSVVHHLDCAMPTGYPALKSKQPGPDGQTEE